MADQEVLDGITIWFPVFTYLFSKGPNEVKKGNEGSRTEEGWRNIYEELSNIRMEKMRGMDERKTKKLLIK